MRCRPGSTRKAWVVVRSCKCRLQCSNVACVCIYTVEIAYRLGLSCSSLYIVVVVVTQVLSDLRDLLYPAAVAVCGLLIVTYKSLVLLLNFERDLIKMHIAHTVFELAGCI